jgi:N utilization substance protein B
MINRVIIRIKVLQVVYAFYLKSGKDLAGAEKELLFSIQKAYDLYHYLLLLIVLLTDAEQKRVDKVKQKLLKTEAELNPDMRLVHNRLAEQLRCNEQLQKFFYEKGSFWEDESTVFIKNLLQKILRSDIYADYLTWEDTYGSDKEFWRKIFKNIIMEEPELLEMMEDKSIYWDDDLDLVGTFALKTLNRFTVESKANEKLLPMFKDKEDEGFAIDLLHHAILEGEQNNDRIIRQTNNWEIERLAQMDLYILKIAIAELMNFPTIPVNVTLNEYIDLSRYYSTPKSPNFINGILDAIVKELKSEGKLFKI